MSPEKTYLSPGNMDASLHLIDTRAEAQAIEYLIQRIAKLNVPVLITGESKIARGLIAHAIHNHSDRSKEPFVSVSCGESKGTVHFESEVFGDEINDDKCHPGVFQSAGKGIVLFDEIGELSVHTQARLLRVVEYRTFFPIGSNHPVTTHARLIFTTGKDLKEMVSLGQFRADLFYRISMAMIQCPSYVVPEGDVFPTSSN